MRTLNVNIPSIKETFYPIFIGDDINEKLYEFFNQFPSKKVVLVTNETIWELYESFILNISSKTKLNIEYCILQDGEIYKNYKSLDKILTCAFEKKLERSDCFIAFGGGVIGDITGFAAAIYLRGINFIQIPTTLLAQVDSSIGGKVAINTPYGKNLLGNFYQPKAVFSNLNFLDTLPQKELLTGLAEVVKYSFIEKTCNNEFSDFAKFLYDNSENILKKNKEILLSLISRCCELKACVVNQDEKEKGLRAILNFGHTIGHSIEKTTNYEKYTHGQAVAIGMKAVFILSKKLNKISDEYYNFAIDLLTKFNLNITLPISISADKILENLIYDKKVKNGVVRFVLPVNYAQVEIVEDINKNVILETVNELY